VCHGLKAVVVTVALLVARTPQATADSYNEVIQDKVKCDPSNNCAVVRTGHFHVSTLAFRGDRLSASDFDSSSAFTVMVGTNVVFDGTLGDDPNYKSGVSRTAHFKITHVAPDTGKTIRDVTILVAGSQGGARIVANGKISAFQAPLLAGEFAGMTDPMIQQAFPAGTVSVQLGSFTDENSDAELVGSALVKTVTKHSQTFDLDIVKIHIRPPL
jgi:hypothetical protein